MDYLHQVAGGARKAVSYLSQKAGRTMDYLKQVPNVGELMNDLGPAIDVGKKLYRAASKRSLGELPSLNEAASGLHAIQRVGQKLPPMPPARKKRR